MLPSSTQLAWDHARSMSEQIAALGLRIHTEHDFTALKRLVHSVPGLFLYPAFDPDAHSAEALTAEDSFWFRVTDADGETVAWHADRMFETDDFRQLLQSGDVWGCSTRIGRAGDFPGFRMLPGDAAPLAGRIAHAGSLWVAPAHRKRGLSTILPSLSRAVCLLEHDADHHTGLVFDHLARSGLPERGYGYPHVELCVDGHFPPTGREERVYLCRISRAETLAAFARQDSRRVAVPALPLAA